MKRYLGIIGIWMFIPLAVVSFPRDIPDITCLAMLLVPLGAILLGIVFFILVFVTRKKPQAAIALFLVLVFWTLSYRKGFEWGARIHLFVNENRYAEKIKQIYQANSWEERDRVCGDACLGTSESPIVTFHYCHCPFYWPDIVYDPTGSLAADREQLRKLNPYLHGSRHLRSFWYIGYYGD